LKNNELFFSQKTFSPRRTRGFFVRLDFKDEITEDSPLVLKDLRIRGLGGLDLNPQSHLGGSAILLLIFPALNDENQYFSVFRRQELKVAPL